MKTDKEKWETIKESILNSANNLRKSHGQCDYIWHLEDLIKELEEEK